MAAVCLKCGVAGFEELLIFCKSCRIYAEHRYCLDRIPKPTEEDVHWLCCQCCPRVPKARVHTFDNLILKNRGIWSLRHTDHGVKSDSFSKKKRHRLLQSPIPAGTYRNVAKQLNGSSHCVEKDVPSDASTLEILRPRDDKYGDDSLVTSEKDVMSPGKNCEQACLAIDEIKKGKRRKLELDDDSDEDNLPLPSGNDYTDPVAAFRCSTEVDKLCRPLSTPHTSFPKPTFECFGRNTVWRGYFNIHDIKYGPIEAHLSKTACEKVCNVVRTLPQMFHFERVPRLDTWPKSFKLLPPADDSIALYFFPGDMRAKAELDQLLDEVIIYDLALKGIVDEADLLLFSSVLLPLRSHCKF
ncbi:unnamed protein product [Spirodela intermedia]|uniref:AIPP2-like SPOC-like domain-containing protein n=1 Tax=Spirodela intermedia TaxID=51605 RepID=A0A7I8L3E3_SPIIN|nr:unnamed protein product [Spirodela intermedia]